MRDFLQFKTAIAVNFSELTGHDMFCTDIDKDELWGHYLASFPEGTNPRFRNRTEHDCGCCKQFIRAVGNVAAIINGKLVSLWDVRVGDPTYQVVADAMAKLVRSKPITTPFLHPEKHAGTDVSRERKNGTILAWDHFHVDIPARPNRGKSFYCEKARIPSILAEKRSLHDVMLRGLRELTKDAVDTVLELIGQNSLYRGNEYKHNVKQFQELQNRFSHVDAADQDNFVWANLTTVHPSIAGIRNTAIGTLLIDLSAGLDLEQAVRKFEVSIMAPTNFKRSTALVTQAMVQRAQQEIEELGLLTALDRRYARLSDITVNNIIFANHETKPLMAGGVFDGIATKPASAKKLDKVETMSIDKFITDVVPNVTSIEVLLENRHTGNLVSLIAPQDSTAKPLLKWDNNFSWSYNGDLADSVKERVKKAGGNVTGDLCCRLAWYNFDDLDLHMRERVPESYEIYYAARLSRATHGQLDVDMNAGSGITREPVENIYYGSRNTMREGKYELMVHNFAKRENVDFGFEVEIDWLGDVARFVYNKAVPDHGWVTVAKMDYTRKDGIKIVESLPPSALVTASKTVWGLKTQEFHKVNVMMTSPNHWDDQRGFGNKHFFFMLDGCINDNDARGFFNEYLRSDLDKHSKVIEIVGGKMRTPKSVDQLSGVGFSDTKRDELTVRVKGNFTRTLKVTV